MTIQIQSTLELRQYVRGLRASGRTVGFVPTMGFLHEGHLSLVREVHERGAASIVSIFVNPTQFNNPEDFKKYPIDLARDLKLLSECGAAALFLPTVSDIYGDSQAFQSWVTVEQLTQLWEGAMRPGHFRGVTTVVSILLNLVQPDFAIFGEKDFQQLRVIERMVDDLKMPVEIVRGALVREPDGLAMSSRNVRLSPEAREASLLISRGLVSANKRFKEGARDCASLCGLVAAELKRSPLIEVEYVGCAAESTLEPLEVVNVPARILVAAQVSGVRLIDNVGLNP